MIKGEVQDAEAGRLQALELLVGEQRSVGVDLSRNTVLGAVFDDAFADLEFEQNLTPLELYPFKIRKGLDGVDHVVDGKNSSFEQIIGPAIRTSKVAARGDTDLDRSQVTCTNAIHLQRLECHKAPW